jgi:hypothetical protein
LRALISTTQTRGGRARPLARALEPAHGRRRVGAGRWSLLRPPRTAALPEDSPERRLADETRHEALARQYVKRYGVVFRDLLARETQAPPWRDIVRIYRRLEMSGELRGGRFVGGFVGEQFASPTPSMRCAPPGANRSAARSSACRPAIR